MSSSWCCKNNSISDVDDLPLSGVRVLELGQLIAGPFCGQLLGHFGAEVIKIEPPSVGDPLRTWRELDVDGVSPWFRSLGRNKKNMTIDLRQDEGRALVKRLAVKSDVIVENFKPGTLEKWGLGPSALHPLNPSLIFTRVSGYGQTGPWSSRPGFASVCEAESGFRYINGFVDPETNALSGPPVRPNMSLGDSVAGLHAAFGTVLALLSRQRNSGVKGGQTVDVSIMESMLNLMEGIIPEYDRKGKVRGPSGSTVTGIVPTNCVPLLTFTNNTFYPNIYRHWGERRHANRHRVARQAEIEEAISDWTRVRPVEEVVDVLEKAGVPVGRVASVKEILENEHLKARGAVEDVWVGSRAKTRWAAPGLGEHTDDILTKELGLDTKELARLRESGIIA
ncbi:L-carnitine dehydratase/bile acid-inducible protein F [Chiua virens]|nr:L-carnitine dehydratase/bile acid-inducible protein F [Chiua virens]